MVFQPHIVIIGAGIIGLSTAYALLERGMRRVTVLEQARVDHVRSTSSGYSRLLRFEYGQDSFYPRMVQMSLSRWKALQERAGRLLYTRTGLLVLGREDDELTRPGYEVVRAQGLPIERLSAAQCRQRFPQFATQGYDLLTYNAEGGILHASACLRALRELIRDLGGNLRESCQVAHIAHDNASSPVRLYLSSGDEIAADLVVAAVGPWVHRLLEHLRMPVEITRQYLLYFAGLPQELFGTGTFPAFMTSDLYGLPIHPGGNGWVKAASHKFGPLVDPDEIGQPDERITNQIIYELHEVLPPLRKAKLAHIDSCKYDVSPDEDFILDQVPGDPRIVFAAGLSGHGFKFGPLIGDLLSSMLCGTQPAVPLGRFRLGRFSREHLRQATSVA